MKTAWPYPVLLLSDPASPILGATAIRSAADAVPRTIAASVLGAAMPQRLTPTAVLLSYSGVLPVATMRTTPDPQVPLINDITIDAPRHLKDKPPCRRHPTVGPTTTTARPHYRPVTNDADMPGDS